MTTPEHPTSQWDTAPTERVDEPATQPAGDPTTEPTTAFERPTEGSTTPGWPPAHRGDEPQPRQLSVSYLVIGLVFLGLAGLWLAQETGAVRVEDLDVLVPLLLVVVGAAGLIASLAKAVGRR